MPVINPLISSIERVRIAGASFKDANIYKNRKDEIEESFLPGYSEMSSQLKKVLASYIALSKICPITADFGPILDQIVQLTDKVRQDEYNKAPMMSIKKDLYKIENDMRTKWMEYIELRTASTTGVLETLKDLIADKPEKNKLDSLKSSFMSSSIGSSAAINAIDEYKTIYDKLMSELDLKDCILVFLKKFTSSHTITLEDMDEEVYIWIKQYGFASKINLSIG